MELTPSKIEAIATQARASVRQELSRTFASVDLDQLAEIAGKLDHLLANSLDLFFRSHPEVLAQGCSYSSRSTQFSLNQEHFVLRISQAILEPDVIEIALLSIERPAGVGGYVSFSEELAESGQYRHIRVFAPRETEFSLASIASLAEALYGTGYRWLEETAKDLANREVASAGHALYRLVRELLPEQSIVDDLWLVAFAGKNGCYLLDREPTDKAIARLSTEMASAGASPLGLMATFLTTILTYAESNSRAAIETMQCIDVSLDGSSYSDSRALFLRAEKVIFGSPEISIFPIYAADAGQLVAVFPARHRALLEPFLTLNRRPLIEQFVLSRSRFKRLLASLSQPRQALSYGKIGEFVGGLVKAVFMEA